MRPMASAAATAKFFLEHVVSIRTIFVSLCRCSGTNTDHIPQGISSFVRS